MRRFPTRVYYSGIYYENELYDHLREGQERPCHIMEGIVDCESVHVGFSPSH